MARQVYRIRIHKVILRKNTRLGCNYKMDKTHIKYIMKRIESAVNDYTTMNRECLAEYVLSCLERLIEECEKIGSLNRLSFFMQ